MSFTGPESATGSLELDAPRRVLLVDDDPDVLSAHGRVLRRAGFDVRSASSADEAQAKLRAGAADVLVSDIEMPGASGIELLRRAHQVDAELPVVLVTGQASVRTAAEAVEHGALRYLLKPVDPRTLVEVAGRAATLRRWARVRRQATEAAATQDLATLAETLDATLATLYIAWQPIVSWSQKRVVAYEALMRAGDKRLPHPGAILDAAERLGRVAEVGRAVRAAVGRSAPHLPGDARIFVNVHPAELNDEALYAPSDPLTAYGKRIVIEVTERAALDAVGDLTGRVAMLRARGHAVALDDIGAGYAGLASFVRLSPDVVKIDMSLVRGCDAEPIKRKLVRAVQSLSMELGLEVVAEGVETPAERDTLVRLGCDYLQGYLFGRPSEVLQPVIF